MFLSSTPLITNDNRSEFGQFVSLFLPIMLSLCAVNLIGFFDRLFLANHSMSALEGYVSGCVLATPFQVPLMRMTTLGQAFVSSYNNDNDRHRIGESIWQLIWLSLFSILIVLPIGYAMIPFVLQGSSVRESAVNYFGWILFGVFLFPLQAALSSFFIGRKKTKIVLITIVTAQCLHILLDYLLIFGVENYIPPLGVMGAAVALVVNQITVCFVLFCLFLRKRHRDTYGTGCYRFNWSVFSSQLRTAIPVALAPFISMSSWTFVSHVMTTNRADHLTVFSIGSALTLGFVFINDSLSQSVMISASALLRKGNFFAIKRLIFHAFILLGIIMSLLAIPFLIYPEKILLLLFPSLSISSTTNIFSLICYTSWIFLLCQGILYSGMGLLVATQKTAFFLFTGSFRWITSYLLVFIAMNIWHWQATAFWLLISTDALIISVLYFFKAIQVINFRRQEIFDKVVTGNS